MNKEISERIFKIIDGGWNIINYTITGYKYVETKLVLHFGDCDKVFIFNQVGEEVEVKKYFTKDHVGDEYLKSNKKFNQLHDNAYQPEDLA
jgi:hypothetical protein